MLALADLAGAEWPGWAREAATNRSGAETTMDSMTLLLNDVAKIFGEHGQERILSRELVEKLNGLADRPWAHARAGSAITDRWLAAKLRDVGIYPRLMRTAAGTGRGYCREKFIEDSQ